MEVKMSYQTANPIAYAAFAGPGKVSKILSAISDARTKIPHEGIQRVVALGNNAVRVEFEVYGLPIDRSKKVVAAMGRVLKTNGLYTERSPVFNGHSRLTWTELSDRLS
jgi:hypothetical protein